MTTAKGSSTTVISDRYELLRPLGVISLGQHYLGQDRLLDRRVVFLLLDRGLTSDRAFVQRFRHQAQAAANLAHPAIVQVLDWGRDLEGSAEHPGPLYYLVREHATLPTVDEMLVGGQPLPSLSALDIAIATTSALGYAHRSGVIHGELRPDCIMVSPTGAVRVADIGLTAALPPDWAPPDDVPELAYWRSPELVSGIPIDQRTDVYGLGLVLYELVTGHLPFGGESASEVADAHMHLVPPPPSELNREIPRPFETIIGRSLAKSPDDRYQTINEQRAALVRLRELLLAKSAPAPAPTDSARPEIVKTTTGAAAPAPPTAAAFTNAALTTDEIPQVVLDDARQQHSVVDDFDDDFNGAVDDNLDVNDLDDQDQGRRRRWGRGRGGDADVDVHAGVDDFVGVDDVDDGVDPYAAARASADPRRAAVVEPPQSRTLPFAILLAVLLAILGVLIFALARTLGYGDPRGDETQIPTLVAKPAAEARTQLNDLGFVVKDIREPGTGVPVDAVFATDPPAGAVVPTGSEVSIHINSGPIVVTVPAVVGQTVDAARSTLAASGYTATVNEVESDTVAAGTVISQNPAAGSPVDAATPVELSVAKTSGNAKIPNVVGKTVENASIDMTQAGFRFATQREASATVASGQVTRTDPAGGSSLEKGGSVIIYVSSGPTAEVPNVVGKGEAEARAVLTAAGFKVDKTTRPVTERGQAGLVISQNPAAATGIEPGGIVVIRVGAYRPPDTKARTSDGSATAPTPTEPATAPAPVAAVTPVQTAAPVTVAATAAPTPDPAPAPTQG